MTQYLSYNPDFLSQAEADALLEHSLALSWQQNQIKMYGKTFAVPRLESIYGDAGCSYKYAGILLDPLPWTNELAAIRQRVEDETWYEFAIVIGNKYHDGAQHIGWHSDDSPEIGRMPAIASVTLGAPRRFSVRHKRTKELVFSEELPHGSLLLMLPGCQEYYEHKLHKTAKQCGLRVNWTFRPHIAARKAA